MNFLKKKEEKEDYKMHSRRIERINKLLKEEVNKILLKEFDFVNVLVTIINVETSDDLKYCDIEVSVLPDKKEKLILEMLKRQIYGIQKTLDKRLKMRPVPRIKFIIDQNIKKLHKIDELLGETHQ